MLSLDPVALAARHPILHQGPAINFFQGSLLGNGGMGVVVRSRPDGLLLHFGHNAVWDVRLDERHANSIGTFAEGVAHIDSIASDTQYLQQDAWYKQYVQTVEASYQKPYPRPFPCGSVVLGWDARRVEVLGHHVDISTGILRVELEVDRCQRLFLACLVEWESDRLWIAAQDVSGKPCAAPIDRIRMFADPSTPKEFPPRIEHGDLTQGQMFFHQTLTGTVPELPVDPAKDRAFRLSLCTQRRMQRTSLMDFDGLTWDKGPLWGTCDPKSTEDFILQVQLDHGLATAIEKTSPVFCPCTAENWFLAAQRTSTALAAWWQASAVQLDDPELEALWYQQLYLNRIACAPGTTAPGLFANWSYNNIGTAWHGDYHLNYNTQQVFWAAFASNHVEQHLPYVDLVERLRPIARIWAKDFFQLPGECHLHSAYPVPMTVNPYPSPVVGWEICETPWVVQSLWWHWEYTRDRNFLATRAWPALREAACFLIAFVRRPDSCQRFADNRYHVWPTVAPELYLMRPGWRHNSDCLVTLVLGRYLLRAVISAIYELGLVKTETALLADCQDVLEKLVDDPKAKTADGLVYLPEPDSHPDVVQNLPVTGFPAFPGETVGLGSSAEDLELIRRTIRTARNEGGNDLVIRHVQAARAGTLDLERFLRQVRYCRLPNGSCSDLALSTGGRYGDGTEFDFMAGMGIWVENTSLPLVLAEALMQSWDGTIRLFPAWPHHREATFENLRAKGAFLVSAKICQGSVQHLTITSLAGAALRLELPWPKGALVECDGTRTLWSKPVLELPSTKTGSVLHLHPPIIE
ncbi:MAG: hypothetical protein WCI20_03910 [bacterium]